jgi:hypothetical protein
MMDTTTNIVIRAEKEIKELTAVLAEFPSPDKWTQEQKAQTVHFAALWETSQKIIAAKGVASIDYAKEKMVFLKTLAKLTAGIPARP